MTQQGVGFYYRFCFFLAGLVNSEGREAQSLMLAKSIEGADATILAATALRDEKTVFYRATDSR